MSNITYITEKLVKVTFIAKMIAWMFASSFSLIFGAFIAKKNTECPYTPCLLYTSDAADE